MFQRLIASSLLAIAAGLHITAQAAAPEKIASAEIFYRYEGEYFFPIPTAYSFTLDNGSVWNSGNGTGQLAFTTLQSIDRVGDTIRYNFERPSLGYFWQQTDYSYGTGVHSMQGSLGLPGPITLTAKYGATEAYFSGYAEVLSNDPTEFDSFNYFAANVGDKVRFDLTYEISNFFYDPTLPPKVFDEHAFDNVFTLKYGGRIDFANVLSAVPEPSTYGMLLAGLVALGAASISRRSHAPKA